MDRDDILNSEEYKKHMDAFWRSIVGCTHHPDAIVTGPLCSVKDECELYNSLKCKAAHTKLKLFFQEQRRDFVIKKYRHCLLGNVTLRDDGFCHKFMDDKCGYADTSMCLVRLDNPELKVSNIGDDMIEKA